MLSLWNHNNTAVKQATTNVCPAPKGKLLLLVVILSRYLQIKPFLSIKQWFDTDKPKIKFHSFMFSCTNCSSGSQVSIQQCDSLETRTAECFNDDAIGYPARQTSLTFFLKWNPCTGNNSNAVQKRVSTALSFLCQIDNATVRSEGCAKTLEP